ncbi:transposase [Actinocrispum wychmicini]|uniref:transposase n=1 Tax=Actinocrispum wychmicini TaxID=1213861 RepID=UPI003C797EAF
MLDAGHGARRIAHLLADLPAQILVRTRSDRVLRRQTPPRIYNPICGRPPKHGGEFVLGDPATWGAEHMVTTDPALRHRNSAGVEPCTHGRTSLIHAQLHLTLIADDPAHHHRKLATYAGNGRLAGTPATWIAVNGVIGGGASGRAL